MIIKRAKMNGRQFEHTLQIEHTLQAVCAHEYEYVSAEENRNILLKKRILIVSLNTDRRVVLW